MDGYLCRAAVASSVLKVKRKTLSSRLERMPESLIGRYFSLSPQGINTIAGGKRSATPGQNNQFPTDPERVAQRIRIPNMAQTLVSLMVHVIFSTKNRLNLITP